MNILQNQSLKALNTFGLDVKTKALAEFHSVDELKSVLQWNQEQQMPLLILGGGSNMLLTQEWNGLTALNRIKGIDVVSETDTDVLVRVGAGVVWHDLVMWSIDKNWGGIENLSLIPGCVGAGPMQNIGAYGVELKDVFVELQALEITTLQVKKFEKADCNFGYRESVFKRDLKGQYIILSVTIKLAKDPKTNVSYGDIQKVIDENGITNPSIKDVSDAVIFIRKSKLPDPAQIGNSGSFFKNPEVSKEFYASFHAKHPDIQAYKTEHGYKVPAGKLIELCGWKGFREGDYGVHAKQALVLVNYGQANGSDIFTLSQRIVDSVFEKYEIALEREVNII